MGGCSKLWRGEYRLGENGRETVKAIYLLRTLLIYKIMGKVIQCIGVRERTV